MDKKFYVPEIEEFRVNFEFEEKNDEGTWDKRTYPFGTVWFSVDEVLDGFIRVKYLDRQDIESLGWEFENENRDMITFSMKPDWNTCLIDDRGWDENDKLWLTLREDYLVHINNGGNYEQYDGMRFYIKNKSELKRLLKQLGI